MEEANKLKLQEFIRGLGQEKDSLAVLIFVLPTCTFRQRQEEELQKLLKVYKVSSLLLDINLEDQLYKDWEVTASPTHIFLRGGVVRFTLKGYYYVEQLIALFNILASEELIKLNQELKLF